MLQSELTCNVLMVNSTLCLHLELALSERTEFAANGSSLDLPAWQLLRLAKAGGERCLPVSSLRSVRFGLSGLLQGQGVVHNRGQK